MKFHRSKFLNLELVENKVYIQNIIFNKAKFVISSAELCFVTSLSNYSHDELFILSFFLKNFNEHDAYNRLKLFISQCVLLREDMIELISKEEYFNEKWEWGLKGAAFHFCIKNTTFYSPTSDIPEENQQYKLLKTKSTEVPSPNLYDLNTYYKEVHNYSRPSYDENLFFNILFKRRSVRKFIKDLSLTQNELINCLYYSLSIKRLRDSPPLKDLPLKMTPSGGTRNPYEAFVFCQNIEGLMKGVYHYSAFENSLALVTTECRYSACNILGDQMWVDDAAAIIILEANLERTMWKYHHLTAYRVAIIEAGHIGQNILLSATAQGFSGTPTAAIVNQYYEEVIGSSLSTKLPTYALVLGHASPDADELKY